MPGRIDTSFLEIVRSLFAMLILVEWYKIVVHLSGVVVKNLHMTAFCDSQVRPFVCGCHYTIIIVHKIVAVIAGAQKSHYTIIIVHKIV